MLQSMGSQRVRHDWATELNWTEDTAARKLRSTVNRTKEKAIMPGHVTVKWF